tara:strand:- start:197 stop:448 length:252 start_codon:yes stop_codon:yes gene_type:complete
VHKCGLETTLGNAANWDDINTLNVAPSALDEHLLNLAVVPVGEHTGNNQRNAVGVLAVVSKILTLGLDLSLCLGIGRSSGRHD